MISIKYQNDQLFDVKNLQEFMEAHGEYISWDVLVLLIDESQKKMV